MSGSQQKKLRQQQRAEGTEKRQVAQKKEHSKEKTQKTKWTIVGIITSVAIIAILLLSSTMLYRNFAAVSISDQKYSAAEYSFFYKSAYYDFTTQNAQYLEMFGLDTKKPLASQKFGEDQTWADFFRESAIASMTQVTMLYEEAQKAGFELSDEEKELLQKNLESIKTAHEGSDYPTADKYLAAAYGKGLNVKTVSKLIEKSFIAESYKIAKQASFTYNDSELESYYEENKDDYDTYTFVSYYADGSEDTEANIDKETAMAKAKEMAESLVNDSENKDEFIAKASSLSENEVTETSSAGSRLSTNYADWIKDAAREEGDKTVIETENGYYALFYVSRSDNNYSTVNVRHILAFAAKDENGEYTEEAKAEAKAEAEKLLKEWEDGEATEESFAELANANSDDSGSNGKGGLYENIYKGQMVPEFDQWIFDENREVGDTGIVFNEDSYCGYHVIYFAGQGQNYRLMLAESNLRSADYTEWETATLENYKADKGFTAKLVK